MRQLIVARQNNGFSLLARSNKMQLGLGAIAIVIVIAPGFGVGVPKKSCMQRVQCAILNAKISVYAGLPQQRRWRRRRQRQRHRRKPAPTLCANLSSTYVFVAVFFVYFFSSFSFVVVFISISALHYTSSSPSPSSSSSASPSLDIYKYFYSFWPFFCVACVASCMQIFVFSSGKTATAFCWNGIAKATRLTCALLLLLRLQLKISLGKRRGEKEVLTCHESAKISNKNIKLLCI